MNAYETAVDEEKRSPNSFWRRAAAQIQWLQPYDKVLDDSNKPLYRWFAGGVLNTCYNAIDYFTENGRADQQAVIYDSPVTGINSSLTYRQLQNQVAKFAGVLASLGVVKGDRVIIYMPMTPEALIGMYACARIGAVHSVVFGGFAARELALRMDDAEPKIVLSASCGIEGIRIVPYKPLLDEAIKLSRHKPSQRHALHPVQIAIGNQSTRLLRPLKDDAR
jgi:propionyl-CoA synthetase